MIYSIFEGAPVQEDEPIKLRIITNRFGAKPDVSIVVVDTSGNVRSGGYIATFHENGTLSLVADVNREFGFKLDDLRRIVLSNNA